MAVEVKNLKIKVIINGQQEGATKSNSKRWTAKEVMEAIQKVNKNNKER